MRVFGFVAVLLAAAVLAAPVAQGKSHRGGGGGGGGLSVTKSGFGSLNGQAIDKYTLSNHNGVSVSVITYGGIIQSVNAPDKRGHTPTSRSASPTSAATRARRTSSPTRTSARSSAATATGSPRAASR